MPHRLSDSDERVLTEGVRELIDSERAVSNDVQAILAGGRVLKLLVGAGAVSVASAVLYSVWYLSGHLEAYAQTDEMARDNAAELAKVRDENAAELTKVRDETNGLLRDLSDGQGRIQSRLGRIEGAVGAHHGAASAPKEPDQ